MMLGFVVAFWAAPRMPFGRLVLSVATTSYILIAVHLEERDVAENLGDAYRQYKKRVSMLLPIPRQDQQ